MATSRLVPVLIHWNLLERRLQALALLHGMRRTGLTLCDLDELGRPVIASFQARARSTFARLAKRVAVVAL